jgi:hypothetical protein
VAQLNPHARSGVHESAPETKGMNNDNHTRTANDAIRVDAFINFNSRQL